MRLLNTPPALLAQRPDHRLRVALDAALRVCRSQFAAVGVFSGASNILQLTVSIYMMQVFDRVMASKGLNSLFFLTIIAVVCVGVMSLLDAARSSVMGRIAAWVEAKVGQECFERSIEARMRGEKYSIDSLRDLGIWRNWVGSAGALSLFDLPWAPVYLGFVFLLHPVFGWIALGGTVLLVVLTLVNEHLTAAPLKAASEASTTAYRRAESVLRNSEVIDSMGMMPGILASWRTAVGDAGPHQDVAATRGGVMLAAVKFVRLAVQIAVLGVGAWLVLRGELTAGASIAGSIVLGRAIAPVEQAVGGWKQFVQARQAGQRLREFLRKPRLRPDTEMEPIVPAEPLGRLEVSNVTYGLPGHDAPLLRSVSCALKPGEILAVIGPSAAGKTTLIRTLVGGVRPDEGAVFLDGADVHIWPREDFGRHVGYLPQAVDLFEGTVFDNIGRMAPDAPPAAVYQAAKLAGCHEMILRLPLGYDTNIGEGGQHLSGGQRQMLGLARAMYGKPRLLILDEPNSNLDGDSEVALMRGILEMKRGGTTVVFVSHRPGLVQAADRVLFLRDGAVEAFGSRDEVLAQIAASRRTPSAPQPGTVVAAE